MSVCEYLPGGAVRLRADGCAFLFARIRPGALLTVITGLDRGDLGLAPLDEVLRESRRFRRPIDWFIDARAAENAVGPVFQDWVRWLAGNRAVVRSVSMVTSTEPMRLTAAMAQHMSGLGSAMSLFSSYQDFEAAIGPEYRAPASNWLRGPAVALEVRRTTASTVIRGGSSVWTLTYPSSKSVLTRIEGAEDGDLRNLHLDEAETMLATRDAPRTWYIDMRHVATVDPRVVDEWSSWLAARQGELARTHVIPPRGAAGLLLAISSARERLAHSLTVHDDTTEFDRAVQQASAAGRA